VTISLPTQRKDLSDLLSKAKISVKPQSVTEKSPEVIALIGEVADYVKPTAQVNKPQQSGKSTGRNAQRKRALGESGKPQNQQSKTYGSRPHSQGGAAGRQRQNSR
jgi:hypothetical protein